MKSLHDFMRTTKKDALIRTLYRGGASAFLIMVIGTVFNFGLYVLLARVLGTSQYGVFSLALAWLSILAIPGDLGMNQSIVRFFPAYQAKGDRGLLRGLIRKSYTIVILTSCSVAILAGLGVLLFPGVPGGASSGTVWLVTSISVPLLALNMLRSGNLQALKRVALAALPEQVIRPITLALTSLILWYVLGRYLNASHVMSLHLGTLILTFIVGGIWLSWALPKEIFDAEPVYETRTWIMVSVPLMCMTAVTYLFGRIGLLMTGGMLGSTEAGIFSAASQIALTLTFGVRSANMIAAPMISELYTTDRMDKLQGMLRVAVMGLIGFTVPLCLGLILFGKWILGFFGQDFVAGYAALVILAVGQTFNALSGSTGFMMTMTKGQNQAAYIMVLTLLVTIGLSFVLIPHWGIVGAAVSVAFGHVLRNVLMLVYVWRELKVDPSILCLLRGRVTGPAS